MLVQKGQILSEIEKLKNLDHHRRRLHEIQERNTKKSVKANTDRFSSYYDPKREQRQAINNSSKSSPQAQLFW